MIDIKNNKSSNIMEVEFIETFTEADMNHFVPVLKKHLAEADHPCMLLIMEEFDGWDKAKTLWEDIKLDTKHMNDVERVALVGDKKWEEWTTKFVRPFTPNELKYFDHSELVEARRWLQAYDG